MDIRHCGRQCQKLGEIELDSAYKLKVRWSKDFSVEEAWEHEDKRYEFLYMVLRKRRYKGKIKNRIIYIGMTYKQFLSDRLKSHHKFPDIMEEQRGKGEVVLKFGEIVLPPNRRISEKLVRDIEAVLIQYIRPEYNEKSAYTYRGRAINLTNIGKYEPLPKKIDTREWEEI